MADDDSMDVEYWWNDAVEGNLRIHIKTCPTATLSTKNLLWVTQLEPYFASYVIIDTLKIYNYVFLEMQNRSVST
jgi:hypothetical protein